MTAGEPEQDLRLEGDRIIVIELLLMHIDHFLIKFQRC